MRGRSLVVRVREVSEIDLRSCDSDTLAAWSRADGWKPEEGPALARRNGVALWLRSDLVDPQPVLRPADRDEPATPPLDFSPYRPTQAARLPTPPAPGPVRGPF